MKPISVSVFLVLIAMIASGCNSDQPSAADLQLISALNDELSFLNSGNVSPDFSTSVG